MEITAGSTLSILLFSQTQQVTQQGCVLFVSLHFILTRWCIKALIDSDRCDHGAYFFPEQQQATPCRRNACFLSVTDASPLLKTPKVQKNVPLDQNPDSDSPLSWILTPIAPNKAQCSENTHSTHYFASDWVVFVAWLGLDLWFVRYFEFEKV